MNFKVGDKVRCINTTRTPLILGKEYTITDVEEDNEGGVEYVEIDGGEKYIAVRFQLIPRNPYRYGDILIGNDTKKVKVLGVVNDIVFISGDDVYDEAYFFWHYKQVKKRYKTRQDKKPKEMTLEQICKELGREIKIVKEK